MAHRSVGLSALERLEALVANDALFKLADEQVRRWRDACDIRDFITAASNTSDPAIIERLTWAANHADSIDPIVTGINPPDIPAPAPRW